MKIKLSLEVALRLMSYAAATHMEFSGFGFCNHDPNGDIFVYDFALLDVGNEGYTEINPKKILPLIEREDHANMKVWVHKHPVTGWSSRDIQTILKEPLGSTPEQVGWSVSMVLTPNGWIGRIDNYKKGITKVLEIEPNVTEHYKDIHELLAARRPFPWAEPASQFPRVDVRQWVDDYEDEYDDDYWYTSQGALDEREDEMDGDTAIETLEELAEGYAYPTLVTLAEVLEDFGIDWRKIQEEQKKQKVRY